MIKALLRWRLARFVAVGALNTAFSYGVYALLLYSGLPFMWANLGALLLGIMVSFRTQGALVFGNRDQRLFWRFVLCWLMIYVVNIGLIALLVALGIDAYGAGALALLPTVVLSFLLQRAFVFGPRETAAPRRGAAS